MAMEQFLLGCNYWASHAGVYTWRDFDKDVITKDLHFLKEYGVTCIRVFPMWEDFQPIEKSHTLKDPFYDKKPFQIRIKDTMMVHTLGK